MHSSYSAPVICQDSHTPSLHRHLIRLGSPLQFAPVRTVRYGHPPPHAYTIPRPKPSLQLVQANGAASSVIFLRPVLYRRMRFHPRIAADAWYICNLQRSFHTVMTSALNAGSSKDNIHSHVEPCLKIYHLPCNPPP